MDAMKKPREVFTEIVCPACNGTGLQEVRQPTEPGRKIYPSNAMPAQARERLWTLPHLGRLRMKNDPYPLHITSALVSLSIVLAVWMLFGNG